VLVCSRQC